MYNHNTTGTKNYKYKFDRFNNGELSLNNFQEAVKHQTGFIKEGS